MVADAYEVLQVHERAELDVIRAAFRTLARKYHPDFGGTGARMVALNEAWAVLSDPKRRKAYDARQQARAAAVASAAAGTSPTASRRAPASPAPAAAQAAYTTYDIPHRPAAQTASQDRDDPNDTRYAARGQTGTILDFGRYAGWSLLDLARQDPYYLEWLERTPIGRPLRAEIQTVLGKQRETAASATATATRPAPRRSRWAR